MKHLPVLSLVCILLLLFSCSEEKITPGVFEVDKDTQKTFDHIIDLAPGKILETYEAVGTVRPLTQTRIEAQINAQILSVAVKPGSKVSKGDLLVKLDARNEQTQVKKATEGLAFAKNRLKQALKSEEGAKAGLDQARAEFERTQKLFKAGVVASQKFEMDQAAFLKAKAGLEHAKETVQAARTGIRQAQQVVNEAGIVLGYAMIKAPTDGVITDRQADPGDVAVPGKTLLILQTSGSLRLEANIREGLISSVHQGAAYDVRIETTRQTVPSVVEEIVPYADPSTRTFLVKATLPKIPGVYPGMFGRLILPVKEETVVLIPQAALQTVGQLEMVNVRDARGLWQSVYVKTGKTYDEGIEVLSGLSGNETIGY